MPHLACLSGAFTLSKYGTYDVYLRHFFGVCQAWLVYVPDYAFVRVVSTQPILLFPNFPVLLSRTLQYSLHRSLPPLRAFL